MSDDGFAAVDAQGNAHSGREPLDVEALVAELTLRRSPRSGCA